MAYWLHCQSCMQWSKSATGLLSEDKSCPFCNNLLSKIKPYSLPNNVPKKTELLNEKEVQTTRLEKTKTSDGQTTVETPAIVSDALLQEEIKEQEVPEPPKAAYQKPETGAKMEVPESPGTTDTSVDLHEKTEESGTTGTKLMAQDDEQLREEYITSQIESASKHELASNEDLEEDKEAVDWELEVDEEVVEKELQADEEVVYEAPETNDAQMHSETDGDSDNQELPNIEQTSNESEQSVMRIYIPYEKSESLEKSPKIELLNITDQNSDLPTVAEVTGPATYEMPELNEKVGEVVEEEPEEVEEVGEEIEEDKEVTGEAPETHNANMNQEANGHSEEWPETEQISDEPEQGVICTNYEKSESLEKLQKVQVSDIPEQSDNSPIVVEATEPGIYEMPELPEKDEQFVGRELEGDEEVEEELEEDGEAEEDEELTCEAPAESEHLEVVEEVGTGELLSGVEGTEPEKPEASEELEAGLRLENSNQQEMIEFIEIVEEPPEQVDFQETASEEQEISKTPEMPDADVKEAVMMSDVKEMPSTTDTLESNTSEPGNITYSPAAELTGLESGEMHITITFDSHEKYKLNNPPAQNDAFSLEPVNEQELLENPKIPGTSEAAAVCEPAISIETAQGVRIEETADSNDQERPKMTRIHEKYIEVIRRTRNQPPIQPQV